jgi:trk system potassium uptake protein TrkH
MTALQIILLIIGDTPVFDAVTLSLGTAGTGGFAVRNSGLAGYSPYVQYVVAIFMILFGVNFNVYILLIRKHLRQALRVEEARWYAIIIILSIAFITINTKYLFPTLEQAFRHALFQVGSIITTTGYATYDFSKYYPVFSQTILILLMFCGACAGSTGGGIKISRILIFFKSIAKEMYLLIHPKQVKKIMIDKSPVEHEVVRATNVYMVCYVVVFSVSMLLVSIENYDLITNFTSVLTTVNNMGPGLGLVGPTSNFGFFNPFTKLVLIFDMLAGRLELFPMLVLFFRGTWKK